jgi:hypothetical protein
MQPMRDRRSWSLYVGLTVPLFVPPFGAARVRDRPAGSSKINELGETGIGSNRPIRLIMPRSRVRVPLSPPMKSKC